MWFHCIICVQILLYKHQKKLFYLFINFYLQSEIPFYYKVKLYRFLMSHSVFWCCVLAIPNYCRHRHYRTQLLHNCIVVMACVQHYRLGNKLVGSSLVCWSYFCTTFLYIFVVVVFYFNNNSNNNYNNLNIKSLAMMARSSIYIIVITLSETHSNIRMRLRLRPQNRLVSRLLLNIFGFK